MEVGSICAFPSSSVPSGFLICDGSLVSRSTYFDLFNVIGTTYGAGDGSTTFALPNLSGRIPMGSASGYALGSFGGEYSHELTLTELAEHDHEVPQHGHSNTIAAQVPELTHSITQPVATYTKLNSNGSRYGSQYPRSVYKNTTSAAMTRSIDVSIANHTSLNCRMGGGITDCGAMTTSAFGSATVNAHNNVMPYLTIIYVIRYEPELPPVLEPNMVMYGNSVMVMTAGGSYLKSRHSL